MQLANLVGDGCHTLVASVFSRKIDGFLSAGVNGIDVSSVVQQQLSEEQFVVNSRSMQCTLHSEP